MSAPAPTLAVLALALASCALTRDPERAAWTSDWNERIDTARTAWDHPCATRAFIGWADGFLIGCDPARDDADAACETRLDWVHERVDQCRAWTAWQLRNFNKHERTDGPSPSMRIE